MGKSLGKIGVTVGCASVLLIAGCTPNTSSNEPDETISYSVSVPTEDFNYMELETTPSITVIKDSSFVLVDGGSSSCPHEIEDVDLDLETNVLTIEYKKMPDNKICTADFQYAPQEIVLKGINKTTDLSSFEYILINDFGQTSSLEIV